MKEVGGKKWWLTVNMVSKMSTSRIIISIDESEFVETYSKRLERKYALPACAACGVRGLPLDFAVHTLETLKYNPDEVYAQCPEYQALFDSIKELIRPSTAGQINQTNEVDLY